MPPAEVLRVVFEDASLIAVDKPSGQVVIPGRGSETRPPLVDAVSKKIGAKAFVVHRIDRETSGLVLFAKDPETHRRLSTAFQDRAIGKTYLALVLGPLTGNGIIEAPLKAFGSGRIGIAPSGKPSTTEYRVREGLPKAALLEVVPRTGRRHQIRAHLYSIGHPVVGDPVYGTDRPVGGAARLMLHALSLRIPAGLLSGEPPPLITAEPGPDFNNILESFRS